MVMDGAVESWEPACRVALKVSQADCVRPSLRGRPCLMLAIGFLRTIRASLLFAATEIAS